MSDSFCLAGLVSISFRQLDPIAIIQAIRDLPIEGIEWGGDCHVPHGDLETAKRVGKLTREAGLESFSYGSYYRFREFDPDATDVGPNMKAVLDSAEALGAKRIRVWAGEKDYDDTDQRCRSQIARGIHDFGEIAGERGIAVDLEFHGGTLNNSATNSLELLDTINHRNVHTLWQPNPHFSFRENLEELGKLLPRISNVHCFHWGPKGFQDRRLLADGIEEWALFINRLKTTKQPHWVSLEFVKDHSLDSLRQDSFSLAEICR